MTNKEKFLNFEEILRFFEGLDQEQAHEISQALAAEFYELLGQRVKGLRNKKRVIANDNQKESTPALERLSEEEIATLPKWVKTQLSEAIAIGSRGNVIQVPDGRKYHIKNSLNHLSGGEWTFFLNSVISTRYPTSGSESYAHSIRKIHPSPKPPQLMKQIIEFFTKEEELVLDYFMGVGGTLIGASLAGRQAIGIDLSSKYIDVYREATQSLGLLEQETLVGNSMEILKDDVEMTSILNGRQISLVAIDPPYGDMMSRGKTGQATKNRQDNSPTPFTDSIHDLGNLELSEFYTAFSDSIRSALPYVKDKGHIVVFIKDMQPQGKNSNLLHARVIDDLNAIPGLQYLGTKIWADQGVNLYPYGYPFAFVANQIHQYIMIFKKTVGERNGKNALGID